MFRAISVCGHVVVITPVGPLEADRSWDGLFHPFPFSQRWQPSPSLCRVGAPICRFEACSTFTRVTTCLLAASPKRHIGLEGSDGFVTSTAAPIATGWSDPVAGWDSHPQRTHDFHGAQIEPTPVPDTRLGKFGQLW